jgi:acetoin utilization deacetylase AcuC-like enzyme
VTERFIYHNPEQDHHPGWIDDDGKPWDVPERIYAVAEALRLDTVTSEWTILAEPHEAEMLPIISKNHSIEMLTAIKEASETASQDSANITPFDKNMQNDKSSGIYRGTYDQALVAAECALAASDALTKNKRMLTLSLSRPPGHHAGKEFYHGFCYINNAAVAAESLKEGGKKVAIIDIDGHHGDGTQDIFYEDGDVYYTSLHANPNIVFPHSGMVEEKGSGAGIGTTQNNPYEIGIMPDQYNALLQSAVDKVQSFKPDYVVVSAGFDQHVREFDNVPGMTGLDDADYQSVGKIIGSLKLPSCVVLEGGYNIETLPNALIEFMKGMESALSVGADGVVMYSPDALEAGWKQI